MYCLLIYDISHDGTRQKVADLCLDYGLQRVQYSAFVGDLSVAHQRELFGAIKAKIKRQAANVQLFPLDAKSWSGRRVFAQGEPTHDPDPAGSH
jgi:CRISPR-associated protein Cas2